MSVSHSPSSTIRNGLHKGKQKQKADPLADRKWWKNLRDFVDDQAIEDVLETMENDRLGLDVRILSMLLRLIPNYSRIS